MIDAEVVNINAKIAQQYLLKERAPEAGVKGTNRKFGIRTVREYADAMVRGEWELTHQGIAFNQDGDLVDGGHRLRAVILADAEAPGITIPFMVTTGLPNAAMAAMDIGKRRVPSDFLRMLGKTNTSSLGGIIRLAYCYYHVPWTNLESWARHRITPRMQEDFLEANPSLEESVYETFPLKKLFKSSAVGAFWFIARFERPDIDVQDFLSQLRTGELLAKGEPALTLRELMINTRDSSRSYTASEELALLIKAFNKWVKGEESHMLAFRNTENFPRITDYKE